MGLTWRGKGEWKVKLARREEARLWGALTLCQGDRELEAFEHRKVLHSSRPA